MAFWGIEIKPSKPYTHKHDSTRGRLRISQVTLGNGKSAEKVTLQCNVGNKSPILLCRLTPDVSETCHLELEFEEDDDVVFSVLGQRSVHLSGYFVGLGRDTGGNETDSYGEDIAHSDSDDSNFYASISEDEYESDFIDDDDDDIDMLPESPRRKSGVVIEEIIDDEIPTNGNGIRRRLKKKAQVVDSDEGNLESQSQLVKGSSAIVDSEDEDGFPVSVSLKNKDGDNIVENAKSDATVDEDRKRKICDILDDPEPKKALDASSQPESGDLSSEKPKKKKKLKDRKPVEKDFVSEVKSEEEAKEPNGAANNGVMDEDAPSSVVPDNEKVEVDHSPPTASGKMKKKNKKKKLKDVTGSDGDQENTEDKVDTTDGEQKKPEGSDQELPKDESNEQEVKKKRRKKKKNKNVVEESNDQLVEVKVAEGINDPKPSKVREFPNGLIIEDVSMGKPDGKRATPGSKVSVHYTGKLKKNGKIFDASRRKPFLFRLGIGEVIKGWDVGVNGMRVGDKRRLTIPPSMGYGNKVTGEIPASSWLVFDVELVDVK